MKKLFAIAFLLCGSTATAAGIPEWSLSRKIVEECYSGWDVKITVTAGAKETYSLDQYSELSSSGEFSGAEYGSLSIDNSDSDSVVRESLTTDYDEVANAYTGELEQDRFGTSAFVGINLTVPLYDRTTRVAKREKKESAVHAMADLYAKYEGYKATIASLDAGEGVLRQIMKDGGETAINAYLKMLADKEKARALMMSSKRKIYTVLEGCGYVARNRTARKR